MAPGVGNHHGADMPDLREWRMRYSILFLTLLAGCGSPAAQGWIVFSSGRSGNGDILAVRTAGDSVRPVVYSDAWWDLHVFDLGSGEESRITFDGTYVGHPSWSPDGSRIAFDRMYGEQTEIALLELATGEIRRLTENRENDLLPSWSRDASRIAFAGVRDGNWDVWTITPDGSSIERITTDPAFDGGPVFAPATALNWR